MHGIQRGYETVVVYNMVWRHFRWVHVENGANKLKFGNRSSLLFSCEGPWKWRRARCFGVLRSHTQRRFALGAHAQFHSST
jgi:hypothetical protein